MAKHVFECIDAHTGGNPVRLVVSGAPNLLGKSMDEKRIHFLKEFDWIRTGLMFEPRGHDLMSGSILYPPCNPINDFGILFIETSGCLPMCGHGTIGTVTIALEAGFVVPKKEGFLKVETPAGLLEVTYEKAKGKVACVKFTNVESYLAAENLTIQCPQLGLLRFDVAYGGNFYAIIDIQDNFSGIQNFSAAQLVALSRPLRKNINETYPNRFVHPDNENIREVSHILWSGKPLSNGAIARNAVFYGDKAIDRSPCGTGTSARMAQWHAQGKLTLGSTFVHESILGSTFKGVIVSETSLGGLPAIIPSIQGSAKVFGHNTITIDTEDDPFAYGFQLI